MYKIIANKAFTDDEDSSIKKIELHWKLNTQWETMYPRFLAELTKGRIMEMCYMAVVDIHVPMRGYDNRLMKCFVDGWLLVISWLYLV